MAVAIVIYTSKVIVFAQYIKLYTAILQDTYIKWDMTNKSIFP